MQCTGCLLPMWVADTDENTIARKLQKKISDHRTPPVWIFSGHLQVPKLFGSVNFSAQHGLKQPLSYGEQGWKLLIQTFQIHLLLLLLDTDSLVPMKTLVFCWLEVLRRPAQLPALHLPGLGRLHHDGRQSFGQLGVLLTWVWEGLGTHLGNVHQSFAQGCVFRASRVCPFYIWHALARPLKNPLPTGAEQWPCTGRISKAAEPSSLLAKRGAEGLWVSAHSPLHMLSHPEQRRHFACQRVEEMIALTCVIWMSSENGDLGDKICYAAKHSCVSSGGFLGHRSHCCKAELNGCCSPSGCCPFALTGYSCFLAVTVY